MVEFVFVHGVATRPGPDHDKAVSNRDALLKTALFAGNAVTISSPMWGGHASALAWDGASFQHTGEDVASLSVGGAPDELDDQLAEPGEAGGPGESPLLASADTPLPSAIDELFAELVDRANAQGRALDAQELAQFQAASQFLLEGGETSASATMPPDEFVDTLMNDLDPTKAYGIVSTLKSAAREVSDKSRNLLGHSLVALFRDRLNPAVAEFLGDVFVYLKRGQTRDTIREIILADLIAAHDRARASGSKLILMGHSLGGVILYDLLSSPDKAGLPADLKVDAFLTVGSQPGLFEELTLFDLVGHDRGAGQHVAGPASVGLWLNIFDPIDLFGFRAEPIFAAAKDFEFDSGTGLASAHSTYFARPQFHARLRKRLLDEGLID